MVSTKILFLVMLTFNIKYCLGNTGFSKLEVKIEDRFKELVNRFTKWLEEFNDKNLGDSAIGKMIRYKMLKPKFGETGREGKGLKKLSLALLPLVFHVGATSTWMLLTSIMAVKSVAIGMLLLVFKIAVSSAKVASFFTALKSKSHHHDWSWNPHADHGTFHSSHDDRSLSSGSHPEWSWYAPEAYPSGIHPYKTIPIYKNTEHDIAPFDEPEYEEPKKGRR